MDGDDNDLGSPHEENMDSRPETSNTLDLNIEQDCCSPGVVHVNGTQSSRPLANGCSTDGLLGIGAEFESDEHAYRFYNKYARLIGFSVRKDWVNRSKVHGQVVSRKFTCSKEGHRRKDKRDVNVKKHRKETRTGCLAHIIITRQPDSKYRVTHFEAEHNHDDINPSSAHMLTLESELGIDQAAEAESKDNLGPRSKAALEIMNRRLEARESLDYLALEYDNYLRSERVRDMTEGEAGRLLHYFQRQHSENPTFFYAIQLDIDDKVSNIFWADDNMVVDYDCFGDVICLDTTCRTNDELRPFVQFIGLNHHKQVVIFAAALLYDDTVESFKWLFRTFADAMSGKKPKAILTDQDAAIVEAINVVFPETNHRICVWQMYENALKHLSHVVKDMKSISIDLRSCIYDRKDEESFNNAWEAMLDKYALQKNEWLRWMYREREKWAVVYGRNTFFVDMKDSHLCEVLSNKLKNYLTSDLDILQFFNHFERVVDELRYKEIEASEEMSSCVTRLMGNVILLKHASDSYTPRAFELFQQGYEKSLDVVVNQSCANGSFFEYKVNTFRETRQYTVTFFTSDGTVVCSCMKFEYVGFLCSHALKVLDYRNIKVVPSQYILKRWTKDARLGCMRKVSEYAMQDNPKMIMASRYKDLCQRILKVSARASESEEAYQFAARQLDEVMEGIEEILTKKIEEAQVITSSCSGANASENEPAEIFLEGDAIENQDDFNRLTGEKEKERPAPDRDPHINGNGKCSNSERILSVELSQPNTVVCVSSSPSAYGSPQATTTNCIMQGLYNFDANQVVHCMYEQPNIVLDPQSNANIYQPPNFFSNQHDSPGQSQLLQEPLIRSAYQESMSSSPQKRQVMDLDIQSPHSSSLLLYDHKHTATDPQYK
ncbi:Protein FAR1-RELATED SEQUENCE 5 [Quillaja saponaria]|uniref:Protein FAR1-RELATED SEQUENCE n=1 Tax=Quillaja saponaria TaxID=32244 RepID=A0AAD7Q6B3_QUISA|nr:Protein FAR1-RELATED SEQUENCE 5 [Quillaja saponaria]